MTELELIGLCTDGESQNLRAEASPEVAPRGFVGAQRFAALESFLGRLPSNCRLDTGSVSPYNRRIMTRTSTHSMVLVVE